MNANAVSAVAAFAAAVGTLIAAGISWHPYRLNIDPHVIVYSTHDQSRPSLIVLIIENIGKGVAYDVKFKWDTPLQVKRGE